jgi:hypothetical protein
MRALAGSLLLLFVASLAASDVVRLTNGDRVSGKVVGKTTRRVRVQTPYGLLVVPREQVEKIERDDGSVEVVTGRAEPRPVPPPPPPQPARLHLVVAGHSFWQAWDPKAAPADPSLRFELRLDEQSLASYTDVNLDPEDLPKAVVNSFVFSPERIFVAVSQGVVAVPPLLATGEIGLALKLPGELAGPHRLSVAYQVNEGTTKAPQWRDVVSAAAPIVLAAGATTVVTIRQNRGSMEYAKRKMRNVETFSATLEPQAAQATAP